MKDIRVLLVDGSGSMRASLSAFSSSYGCAVEDVRSVAEARDRLDRYMPDVVLLDLDQETGEGPDFILELTAAGISTIVLSGRNSTEERIRCFEKGAQDFIAKPVDPRELQLRIGRLWLGPHTARTASQGIPCGAAKLDVANRLLMGPSSDPIPLTSSEFRLLYLLVRHEGRIVERTTISRDVLGHGETSVSRSVDVMVSKLRRKLLQAEAERFIRNVRSEGYVLVPDARRLRLRSADSVEQSV